MDTIKITPPAGSPIEITPLSESYARTALQEIDTLVLHYELPEHTDLPLGSTASFRGTTYTLYKTSDLTMHHSRAYEYTATLYGDGERTRLYKVANLVDGRLSFTLTAKPHEHLQMLVDTLNKREGAGTWTRGSVPDGTEITIAYDHVSVLDALVQLATKLETEWGITGTTLHIGKLTSSSDPLSLRYGRGKGILPDIRRVPVDDYPIGRLYANGGSRNIDPAAYGSKTLHFPKGATLTYEGQVYHTDPTGTYVYPEGAAATSSDTSIDLTHIYPSRIGSVTKVEVTKEGAVDILDSTIPETLDYEKQLLEGQTLTVKFETGMLAGREAFGAKYIHRDRRFQIVPRDEDGITLPGGVYLPKEGDKYAVFGCSLPLQYISDAETAMLSEAVKYLHSHQTEQYNITIELDGIYTKQHWGEIGSRLALGHRVRFTDPSWQPTPVDIRILGITTYLSRPYSPKLDLSNSPLPSSFTAVIKRVEGDQLVREEEYRGGLRRLEKRTYEDAKATREMIERLRVEGFTHSITPETLRTLQAVIGSPSLQFSFGRDDGQELFPFEYEWRKGKTELHIPGRQYILQEKGDKTLSPDAKQKVTEMAEYTYSLKDEETQLYLYADLTEQSYKVSATPMEITDTRLLVALIHGVGEDRTLTPLYGFTEITPGQLKTDLIRSQDGKSYWDLLSGKFATKGDLLIGDPKGNTCLAYIDGVLYVKGLTVNVGSSSTTIEDALLEQERKLKDAEEARAKAETEQKREIENAKKVRQPIIKNGTWWVWDDTTNQLIDSGKPAQGANGKDATPVRDNLFTAKLYTFSQNDYYGAKRTHLGDGRWRVEKVAKSDKKRFDGASFYVSPIRDTKPGRYTISFRVVETSRPIKSNGTAIGDRYISTSDSADGRLPGFSFYWGETTTKGNEIGDFTIIDQVKIERVAEGEDPMPTAYLPHPLDLKGEPGKDVDPKVLNDLKTAVDDARRKLDDTVTKAELDGVVSAQEERDIQFAKEALNAAMQAYDDAVKKAKELDREIQVGGRNLLLDTSKERRRKGSYSTYRFSEPVTEPGKYILSFDVEVITPPKGGEYMAIFGYRTTLQKFAYATYVEGATHYEMPIDVKRITQEGWASEAEDIYIYPNNDYVNPTMPDCGETIFSHVKLERGTVATDWTPAPDDLQAAIDKVERGYQKLIERIDVEFAVSSSRTTAPASGWQTTAPTTTKGQALWQRTKVYLKDGTTEVRGTTCIQGRDGTDGRDGGKGADGRGITAVKELYYLSTSNTELKGGTWSETAPTPREGCWIWTMTRIYYTTGTPTTTKPICVTGAKGDTGAKGEKGDGLDIIDTRNDNQPPSWYREKYALTTVKEFKSQSTIRIPSSWQSGTYCTLETTVRWADPSGGRVEQSTTLDNGTQLRRVGTSDDTAWEPWINVSAEIREVATGLSSANTLIQSLEKAQEMLDTGKLNKADLPNIQYLLDSLQDGSTSHKGGLFLTNDIILSDPKSKEVTASMSGTRTSGAKAIRLGIKYSGDHVDYLFNAPFFNAEYNNLTNLEDDNAREKRINELGYSVAEYNKFLRNWRVYPTAEKKEVGETSAFFNDGKAHIGDLFFNGEYISFGTDKDSYMQIGGSAKPESEMVSASTEIRKFGIASRTLTKSGIATLDMFDSRYSNREIKYTANLSAIASARACEVPIDGGWDPTRHRYNPPEYRLYSRTESYVTAQLKLELSRGGSVIKTVTSPEVSVRAVAQGGQFANNEQVPQDKLYADDSKSQAVIITISQSDVREQDTVTLSLITKAGKYCNNPVASAEIERCTETSASAENIINYLPYDTSKPMISVTKDRAAFFYGRSSYILLNYLRDCVMKVVGNMIIQGNLTIKGDLKTEYADFPGAPLCGGMVTENGSYKKSFGRYKNQSGRNIPQVSYDYSTKVYTVYHSIGNDRYIPSLTVYGPEGMSRCLCIMSVDSYSFKVKAYNSGNWEQAKAGFSYVCFKA